MTEVREVTSPQYTHSPDAGKSASTSPPDVSLVGVSKKFGEFWALHPTHLDIVPGEFFSLLGASGSGKTTTLRIIAGFERPSDGQVHLGGRDATSLPPYERSVNTVFQDYALFPHMTVEQNVAYGLSVRRVAKVETRRRVNEALELVQLDGYEKRRPSQLSGGQRQRVALARALINAPKVLLLDEPLGALDLKLRREMQTELKRIQSDVGITFLYVTHDQDEAMSMSDRIAVMSEGRIVQIGSPEDVYERPQNAFIAGFVGTSNVLTGRIARSTGTEVDVDVPDLGIVRCRAAECSARVGERVLLTVRPEKISLADVQGDSSGRNAYHVRITALSYGGAFTRYEVGIGSVRLAVLEQNAGQGSRWQVGEEVYIAWSAETAHVLPGTQNDRNRGNEERSKT